jgi:hypothetical protein
MVEISDIGLVQLTFIINYSIFDLFGRLRALHQCNDAFNMLIISNVNIQIQRCKFI